MKKLFTIRFWKCCLSAFSFFLFSASVYSQNAGIGAVAFLPNASSMLDIQSNGNKGFLPPRVTDVQRAAMNPLPAAAQGLIVYQTNTVGASLEGLYYNTSLTTTPNWIHLDGGGWTVIGNVSTVPGTAAGENFLGTTDNTDFIIATNLTEAVRVRNNQFVRLRSLIGAVDVGAGTSIVTADVNGEFGKYIANMPPLGTLELWFRPVGAPYIQPMSNLNVRVYDTAPVQPYGVYYDGGTNAVGGYFRTTSSSSTTVAVEGFSDVVGNQTFGYLGYNGVFTMGVSPDTQRVYGMAVYGLVDDPNRVSVFSRTTANATFSANINYSNVWIGSYSYIDDISTTYATRPAKYGQLNTHVSKAGYHSAIRGYSIYKGGGNPGYVTGGNFTAVGSGTGTPATEDGQGVYGIYAGVGTTRRAGGYFYATDGAFANYAFVGDQLLARKITGVGAVSEIIPTPNHGRIMLTCPESPEYWYIDYGTVQLVNGSAHVDLDPVLKDIIIVDAQNPLKVFPQANIPNCSGVAIVNKSSSGFDIVEVNNGTSNGEVDYQIVARPKTNYGEGRFPQAPGPMLKVDPPSAQAANRPDRSKVFRWPADWDVYGYNVEDNTAIGDVVIGGPNAGKVKLANGKFSEGVAANNDESKTDR